jgi:hypothetical protein
MKQPTSTLVVGLAGLAVALAAACGSLPGIGDQAGPPPEHTLGSLRVGSYNYVAACDVFTAQDYQAITGRLANGGGATYAARTYQDEDPYRSYDSRCSWRTGDGEPLALALQEYPTPERSKAQNGAESARGTDKDATSALGADTYQEASGILVTYRGNKRVAATGGDNATAVKMLKAVLKHLQERFDHASQPSDPTRWTGSAGAPPALAACGLFTMQDFTQVLGKPGDEGEIEVGFPAVRPGSRPAMTSSSCRVGSQPAKSSKEGSAAEMENALRAERTTLEVTVEQSGTAADAHTYAMRPGTRSTPVRGLGDEAIVPTPGQLRVRKGANVATINAYTSRGALNITPASADAVRQLAAIAVGRMP